MRQQASHGDKFLAGFLQSQILFQGPVKMQRFDLRVVLVAIQVVISFHHVEGELFTALVHMEGLLDLERELLGSLNSYIVAEKER